ncbi:MAG: type II secretion system F family protein [Planctomycetaceae bacterium]
MHTAVPPVGSPSLPLLQRATASRQAALLWVLAIAVEKQLPLVPMLDAFADDSRKGADEVQRRLLRAIFPILYLFNAWWTWPNRVRDLADRLRAGEDLPTALEKLPGLVPRDAVLAARVGLESGTLAASLRMSAAALTRQQESIRPPHAGLFLYLATLAAVLVLVLSFIMIWIIPKFKKIFEDFGTELPDLTEFVIEVSDGFAQYWFLVLPLALAGLWCLVSLTLSLELGRSWSLPRLCRPPAAWRPRAYAPWILRILNVVIAAGRPLGGALLSLAHHHPDRAIRQRLQGVYIDLERGEDVWRSLVQAGFLRRNDAALLSSAERAGNLPWALMELAHETERRMSARVAVALELLRPLLLAGFGVVVGTVVVAVFLPMVKLINDLS